MAERGAGFTTGTGQLILGRLQSDLGFFRRRDVDQNTVVNAEDASLLNEMNIGIFFFAEGLNIVPVSVSNECYLSVSVHLAGKSGAVPDPTATRVYFDLSSSDGAFTAKLNQSMLIGGWSGGLVEANLTYATAVMLVFARSNSGVLSGIGSRKMRCSQVSAFRRAWMDERGGGAARAGVNVTSGVTTQLVAAVCFWVCLRFDSLSIGWLVHHPVSVSLISYCCCRIKHGNAAPCPSSSLGRVHQ